MLREGGTELIPCYSTWVGMCVTEVVPSGLSRPSHLVHGDDHTLCVSAHTIASTQLPSASRPHPAGQESSQRSGSSARGALSHWLPNPLLSTTTTCLISWVPIAKTSARFDGAGSGSSSLCSFCVVAGSGLRSCLPGGWSTSISSSTGSSLASRRYHKSVVVV